jgi:hypothetical protein
VLRNSCEHGGGLRKHLLIFPPMAPIRKQNSFPPPRVASDLPPQAKRERAPKQIDLDHSDALCSNMCMGWGR